MNSLRIRSILSCLLITITTDAVFGNGEGQLLCDSSDPICQKFKHMLRQQEQSVYKSGQDNEDQLLCDKKDPICQKFQQMLDEQNEDEYSGNARININQRLNCDSKDPICQKFQNMLKQQRKGGGGGGNQGSGGQGSKPMCNQALCMMEGKTCWTNGECKDLVTERET